jgi:hypothetical protein
MKAMISSLGCHHAVASRGYGLHQRRPIMNVRENAAKIASQFEGRCTCAAMDGGVDCPWCQVFYDVLQGYPLTPLPRRDTPTTNLSTTAA